MARNWLTLRRLLVCAFGALVVAAVAPAGAWACSIAAVSADVVAPAENASLVQTGESLPVQIRFGDNGRYSPVQVAVARMTVPTLPPVGTLLPPDVGTVVETVSLTYDPATGTWGGAANGNDWAQTPGEYVWQVSGTLTVPAPPPPPPGVLVVRNSCDGPFSVTMDGRWAHRLTVVGASAVTVRSGKARDGRAKVSGRVATAFAGRVKLTVACPGKRTRSTFVPTADGRWSRKVFAKRGCSIKAAIAARQGWAASEAATRVN
jgi:hypothetical protein